MSCINGDIVGCDYYVNCARSCHTQTSLCCVNTYPSLWERESKNISSYNIVYGQSVIGDGQLFSQERYKISSNICISSRPLGILFGFTPVKYAVECLVNGIP